MDGAGPVSAMATEMRAVWDSARNYLGLATTKKLGVDTRPLSAKEETLNGTVQRGETRIKACTNQLLRTIRIPGFEYGTPWLEREMSKQGYTSGETEETLDYLVSKGVLAKTDKGVKMT